MFYFHAYTGCPTLLSYLPISTTIAYASILKNKTVSSLFLSNFGDRFSRKI
jgi:hypothetical protein